MNLVADSKARVREVQRPDGVGRRRDYFGEPGEINADPQAFLVELPYPEARVHPHFHDIDQFQVVVAGDGRVGKRDLDPVTFQYADAFTPYGPIVARDDGISFFTLRNVASGGHFKMPGSRHLMPCRAGRNLTGRFDLEMPLPAAGEVSRESLLDGHDDGLLAVGLRLGAGARTTTLESSGGGQYFLVCTGTLVRDGERYPANSLIRVDAGEAVQTLEAGPEGAAVLAMQYPRASDRPGSDPALLAARDPQAYVRR